MENKKLLKILKLIGLAHDIIIESQNLLSEYYGEDDNLHYLIDSIDTIESELSEFDYIGYDNPIEEFYKKGE